MIEHRAILIAGPTASGKSALALALAERHRGVVINADSCQVYGDLAILTARPDAADLARRPHLLYGHVAAAEAYSVGRWLREVAEAIAAVEANGETPIVVGGTGLYFKALLEGLSPIPPVPEAVREHWRGQARRLGAARLHAVLVARDPEAARRIAPSDTQRLTRALEVLEATGRTLGDWQRQQGTPVVNAAEALLLVADAKRDELYRRAEARFDQMLAQGALAEVERLAAKGLSRELPSMRALGVGPLLSVIGGVATLEQAAAAAKQDTRHYIKRQETWIKRHMIAWNRLTAQQMENIEALDFTFR